MEQRVEAFAGRELEQFGLVGEQHLERAGVPRGGRVVNGQPRALIAHEKAVLVVEKTPNALDVAHFGGPMQRDLGGLLVLERSIGAGCE